MKQRQIKTVLIIPVLALGVAFSHASDLPEKGTSLFDKVYSQTLSDGSAEHKIPFPFSELVNSFQSAGQPVTSLVPLGRSIQKPHLITDYPRDISFNPFEFPRSLIAVKPRSVQAFSRLMPYQLQARIFIGYLEPKKQLEVISYNDELGRFEYQVVKNYGLGLKPKVYYVKRNLCVKCHQNGGPIFSLAQWEDTNNNFVIGKVLRAHQIDHANHYQSLPIRKPLEVQEFDGAVRSANELLERQRMWRFLCSQDPDKLSCRKNVVLSALRLKEVDPESEWLNDLAVTFAEPNAPKRISSFIGEYNPVSALSRQEQMESRQCKFDFECVRQFFSQSEILFKLIRRGQNLVGEEDPSAPRKAYPILRAKGAKKRLVRLLPRLLRPFLSDDDIRGLETEWRGQASERTSADWHIWLKQFIENPSRDLEAVFLEETFSRRRFVAAILSAMQSSRRVDFQNSFQKAVPLPELYDQALDGAEGVVQILSKRCGVCHSGPSNFPPPFLKASDSQEVISNLNRNGLWQKAIAHIKGERLPQMPLSAPIDIEDPDYAAILEFLSQIPELAK